VQRDEARRLHHVPDARIVMTGAQCFDQWFDRRPSRTREAFCAQAGLPSGRPFVLYVGSALFRGSPPEAQFALRWIAAVRASADPVLRSAPILVRPHPQRMHEWDGVDVSHFGEVVVWGGNPVTDTARADYFDSLAHSAAVVGLNTSAFLEAAIAGRPVLAILPPEFHDNQEGTIHFHYLTDTAGGVLRTSRSIEAHVAQLADTLTAPWDASRHAAFLRAFVRPNGLDAAATPAFADAVDALHRAGPAGAAPRVSWVARQALEGVRRLSVSPQYRHWLMDEEDRRSDAWRQERARQRAEQRRAGLTPEQKVEAERRMRETRGSSRRIS
jgi:hypothetical protein